MVVMMMMVMMMVMMVMMMVVDSSTTQVQCKCNIHLYVRLTDPNGALYLSYMTKQGAMALLGDAYANKITLWRYVWWGVYCGVCMVGGLWRGVYGWGCMQGPACMQKDVCMTAFHVACCSYCMWNGVGMHIPTHIPPGVDRWKGTTAFPVSPNAWDLTSAENSTLLL